MASSSMSQAFSISPSPPSSPKHKLDDDISFISEVAFGGSNVLKSNKRARLTRAPTPARLTSYSQEPVYQDLDSDDDDDDDIVISTEPPREQSARSYSPTLKNLDGDYYLIIDDSTPLALDTDTTTSKRIRVDPQSSLASEAARTTRRVRFDEAKNEIHLYDTASPPHTAASSSQESALSDIYIMSPPSLFAPMHQGSPPLPKRPSFFSYSPPPPSFSSASYSPILHNLDDDVPEEIVVRSPPRPRSPFTPRRPRNTDRPGSGSPSPRVPMLKREVSNVSFLNSYPVSLEDRAAPLLRSPSPPRASSPLRPPSFRNIPMSPRTSSRSLSPALDSPTRPMPTFASRIPTLTKTTSDLSFTVGQREDTPSFVSLRRSRSLDDLSLEAAQTQFANMLSITPPDS
ncbi:hypothetical protein BG006_011321 [Podila minutissima]|uniref:Uncharacterized protein n=1 Tax=Podila minutissima TaxID=64525 RepID=A0A9P5SBZ1_9FUNG|nr:hypothetical protein BG006_011321 [Podila minutissima]